MCERGGDFGGGEGGGGRGGRGGGGPGRQGEGVHEGEGGGAVASGCG